MSSNKWFLVLAAVVVIGGGLWWSGMLGGSSSQGAAVATNTATNSTTAGDPTLKANLAKIDAQISVMNTSVNALGSAPSKAQVSAAAANLASVIALMGTLSVALQTRSVNAKAAGGAMPSAQVFTAIAVQLSNAGSLASSVNKNNMATSTVVTKVPALAAQLKSAQTAVVAARASIGSVFATLKIN